MRNLSYAFHKFVYFITVKKREITDISQKKELIKSL